MAGIFTSTTQVVRQVHRGTVTISAAATTGTATISPSTTDTNKLLLTYLGFSGNASGFQADTGAPRIALTAYDTITATRNTSSGATVTVSFEVWELW